MKCKFEHDGDCCNCGSQQYMCKCKPKICGSIVPITNADRIRAMSDEELAKWLEYEGGGVCAEVCGWMNWLQQPAEADI